MNARFLAMIGPIPSRPTLVTACLYAGLAHGETMNASLKDSVPFLRKILAGEPIKPLCEPVAE